MVAKIVFLDIQSPTWQESWKKKIGKNPLLMSPLLSEVRRIVGMDYNVFFATYSPTNRPGEFGPNRCPVFDFCLNSGPTLTGYFVESNDDFILVLLASA